jgi:hypothetical protein
LFNICILIAKTPEDITTAFDGFQFIFHRSQSLAHPAHPGLANGKQCAIDH